MIDYHEAYAAEHSRPINGEQRKEEYLGAVYKIQQSNQAEGLKHLAILRLSLIADEPMSKETKAFLFNASFEIERIQHGKEPGKPQAITSALKLKATGGKRHRPYKYNPDEATIAQRRAVYMATQMGNGMTFAKAADATRDHFKMPELDDSQLHRDLKAYPEATEFYRARNALS